MKKRHGQECRDAAAIDVWKRSVNNFNEQVVWQEFGESSDAPLIERRVEFQSMPSCKCCGSEMSESGLTEDSEFLTVIPAQYLVVRQMRQTVRFAKCYGDLQTAPSPHR